MNHLKALLEAILDSVLAQAHNIIRIAIERDNLPGLAREPGGSQREIAQMSTDVVYNSARMNGSPKCALHLEIMLAPPIAGFIRKLEPHPHPASQTFLYLHPDARLRQHIPTHDGLKPVQRPLGGRPSTHYSPNCALRREIQSIKDDREARHIHPSFYCRPPSPRTNTGFSPNLYASFSGIWPSSIKTRYSVRQALIRPDFPV